MIERSPDLKACNAPASFPSSSPMIDGIPSSRPSRRWHAAQVAASWAPRLLSAAKLSWVMRRTGVAQTQIWSAMSARARGAFPSHRHFALMRPASRHQKEQQKSQAAPASTDHEIVRQRVSGAAVFFPYEFEPAALRRPQVKFDVGVGSDRFVEIDLERHDLVVAAGELIDDLARDDVALVIMPQAGLHLMANQGFDLKDFALRRSARHLYAWYQGKHSPSPAGMSDAAVGGNLDPRLGRQQRAVVHFGYCQDILRFGDANARRHARLTALRGEIKGGDVDDRVPRRQHADIPHVVGFSHWAVDIER